MSNYMTNLKESERDQVRATMEQILVGLETDPTFAAQVRADPTATLTSAGLPEDAITEVLEGYDPAAEVSGYLLLNVPTLSYCRCP